MPEPADVASILEYEGIQEFETDLRRFSRDELQLHFAAASSGRIILTKVIKNLIWQAVSWIRSGRISGIEGNLRSFFYQWVKPVMAHIPGALEQKRDPYSTMLDVFVELVEKYQLFRYAELDLDDANWEHRRIGEQHPHILIFAEKIGFFRLLRRIHSSYSVTVAALGGTPSLLSTEYLVRSLGQFVDLDRQFVAFFIVDWDPSGYQIIHSQLRQLRSLGIANIEHHELIKPEHYAPEEIEIFRFPLPGRQKTKNRKWLEATGGLNGELYGLEADSMPRERLMEKLEEKIRLYLSG